MATVSGRKPKGTPTTRKILFGEASPRNFSRFSQRKTMAGKTRTEIAGENTTRPPFPEISLQQIRAGKRGRYAGRYLKRDPRPVFSIPVVQLSVARQIVFHHERNFPLKPGSLLDNIEKTYFVRLAEFHDTLKKHAKIEVTLVEFKEAIIRRKRLPDMTIFWHALKNEFPSAETAVRAIVKMYGKNHKMRKNLEWLNDTQTIEFNRKSGEILQKFREIIDYLAEEAKTARETAQARKRAQVK